LQGADFKDQWDRIKHKTTYRVHFDNEALLVACIRALKDAPPIAKTRLQWRKADLATGKAGVEATETATSAPVTLDEGDIELPDILTDLQDKTQLTGSLIPITAPTVAREGRCVPHKMNLSAGLPKFYEAGAGGGVGSKAIAGGYEISIRNKLGGGS